MATYGHHQAGNNGTLGVSCHKMQFTTAKCLVNQLVQPKKVVVKKLLKTECLFIQTI